MVASVNMEGNGREPELRQSGFSWFNNPSGRDSEFAMQTIWRAHQSGCVEPFRIDTISTTRDDMVSVQITGTAVRGWKELESFKPDEVAVYSEKHSRVSVIS